MTHCRQRNRPGRIAAVYGIRMILLSALAVAMIAGPVAGQLDSDPPTQRREVTMDEMPWPARLGVRVLRTHQLFPVIDRVVLVPDAATYLDELGRWSPQGRWPVLIEDDRYAPMFIRRFDPAEVIRREPVGDDISDHDAVRRRIDRMLVSSWGANPDRFETPADAMVASQHRPPGVVFASLDDPAWTAGVALAAGHVQPLLWLDGDYGSAGSRMNEDRARELLTTIRDRIDELPFEYAELGDMIDAVTVCRTLSGRVHWQRRGQSEREEHAVTDLIGRDLDDESRWACAGWIFGSETRSAYIAMSSLFLDRERVTLYNTYSTTEQGFSNYNVEPAADVLRQTGYTVEAHNSPNTTRQHWLGRLPGGWTADLIMVNSQGNADFFVMQDGEHCYPPDVPILNTPAAVYFVHSWSMQNPSDLATVAGRWIDHGAYAYVGSMYEPYLQAFLPPSEMTRRMASYVPMLVAARQWNQHPWRINTFGDALMLCAPPESMQRDRESNERDDGENLGRTLRERLSAYRDAGEAAALSDAAQIANLLGRDDLVLRLWDLAVQDDARDAVAGAVLGALFRANQPRRFVEAWGHADRDDRLAHDLLWHQMTPRLGGADADALEKLGSAVRYPMPHVDLRRLRRHYSRAFGPARFREIVEHAIETSDRSKDREALRELIAE